MLSYWEQESFTKYDHVIIGAGLIGLSVALEIRERFPKDSILVLERGLLPTGASTRNAGFACMGSVTELMDDLSHMSEEEVVQLFEWRYKGLLKLRARLGDQAIGYKEEGSYELIGKEEISALERIEYFNRLLYPVLGKEAFSIASDKIPEFGFEKNKVDALICNNEEGGLHSGMMMRALTNLALAKEIEIKTGAIVDGFEEEENGVRITVTDPFRKEILPLKARTLSICTNAFTKKLLPDADVTPGRGQVLITDKIPGLKFKGIFHFDRGYYYFRELDGRVLIGGGRNLDFEGETTTILHLNQNIQQHLEQKLRELILPGTPFTISQRWAGIMAFGPTKWPVVKQFSDHVYGAFRMGGMGVALGSEVAVQLAEIISSNR